MPRAPRSWPLTTEPAPMTTARHRPRSTQRFAALLLLVAYSLQPTLGLAQERPPYLLGERHGLDMVVHIIGEVQKPGEYRVPDQTNVLELVSKAGGPTQFSRLSEITVRRSSDLESLAGGGAPGVAPEVKILHFNLERTMSDQRTTPLVLRPGDVILVPKNSRQGWLDVSSVVRDLSIVASSYFLYLRATK